MTQTDYIMRMIEQAAQVLWHIVFNKKMRNYDGALEEIERACNGLLHTDHDSLRRLAVGEIVTANTSFDGVIDRDSLEITARLLFEEADILEQIHGPNDASGGGFEKAFLLLRRIAGEGEGAAPDAPGSGAEVLGELAPRLEGYDISPAARYGLFQYYEEAGLYGRAEDCLYDLRERGYPGAAGAGKEFYARLLDKDDAALEKGNLPREEVLEGLTEWEKRETTE